MFIVVAETNAQVYETYIIGLADEKHELYALLFDFYNYLNVNLERGNYEQNWIMFDVTIYDLSSDDHNKINIILEKYSEQVETWRENFLTNKNIENFYNNILLIPIEVDDLDDFDNSGKNFIEVEDQDLLKEIISHCNKVL